MNSDLPYAELSAPGRGRIRPVTGLGLAIAGVLVAAVIGVFTVGPAGRPAIAQVLSEGASNTLGAGGMHMTMSFAESVSAPNRTPFTVTLTGSGVSDPARHLADLTETVPHYGAIEVRLVGQTVYFHPPADNPAIHAPTPWLSLAVPAAGASGSEGSLFYDPTGQLQALVRSGYAQSVTDLGTDAIDGVTTTHYQAVLDSAAVMKEAADNPLLGGMAGPNVHGVTFNRMTLDAWVGSDDIVRQVGTTGSLSVAPPGQPPVQVTVTFTLKLSDFGTPVNVTAPPPSQVTPVGSLHQVFGVA